MNTAIISSIEEEIENERYSWKPLMDSHSLDHCIMTFNALLKNEVYELNNTTIPDNVLGLALCRLYCYADREDISNLSENTKKKILRATRNYERTLKQWTDSIGYYTNVIRRLQRATTFSEPENVVVIQREDGSLDKLEIIHDHCYLQVYKVGGTKLFCKTYNTPYGDNLGEITGRIDFMRFKIGMGIDKALLITDRYIHGVEGISV